METTDAQVPEAISQAERMESLREIKELNREFLTKYDVLLSDFHDINQAIHDPENKMGIVDLERGATFSEKAKGRYDAQLRGMSSRLLSKISSFEHEYSIISTNVNRLGTETDPFQYCRSQICY